MNQKLFNWIILILLAIIMMTNRSQNKFHDVQIKINSQILNILGE